VGCATRRPRRGAASRGGDAPAAGRRGRVRASAQQPDKGFNLLETLVIPQGLIVKGAKATWFTIWEAMMKELAPQDSSGSYARPKDSFQETLSAAAGAAFPASASGRYHLYSGNACPWCHRALLALALRGLCAHVSVTHLVSDAERASRGGWVCDPPEEALGGQRDLRQVYDAISEDGAYVGRCTAPLLVDKLSRRGVNNNSWDIVRMLNEMDLQGAGAREVDLYPEALRAEIDAQFAYIYEKINNGVYRCGFSTTQAAYDRAVADVSEGLAAMEERLQRSRFVVGDKITLADVVLFPTISRFDTVYGPYFRCGGRRIADFPALYRWCRDFWNLPPTFSNEMSVREAFDLAAAKESYYKQLFMLNPSGIVPRGLSESELGFDSAPEGTGYSDVLHYKS